MKWRGSHRVTLSGMPRSFIDRGLDPIGEAPGWSVKRERRRVKMLVAAGADGRIGEGGHWCGNNPTAGLLRKLVNGYSGAPPKEHQGPWEAG